jgi:thiamine biosynthesis lipoprotein ApbE
VASATVIAPTAVEADALSTALCILGPEEGLRLIRELGEGYEALILFRREEGKYEWHSTPGYEDRRVDRPE